VAEKPGVDTQASRRPGGAVHRGMVLLLRQQTRWLVDRLVARRFLPPGPHWIEMLPTETWPVGEENRGREIRADVVLRLWPIAVPEDPSLELIRASHVMGLILDYQDRRDRTKELRLLEYDSAYPPILGPHVHVVVLTLHGHVARWMEKLFARKHLSMQTCVLSPTDIPRGDGLVDAHVMPRRAVLDAMLYVRDASELQLLTNALRALRRFEGNELHIYQEMLLSQMKEALIMQAQRELEPIDEYDQWVDYVVTEQERESFLYVHGERRGRREGLQEGRQEGLRAGRAQALLDLLRIRAVDVDAASEAKILACHDAEQLSAWLGQAITITRIEELFDARSHG
jgi:hypothetical protein